MNNLQNADSTLIIKHELLARCTALFDKLEANNDTLDSKSWQLQLAGSGIVVALATFGKDMFSDGDASIVATIIALGTFVVSIFCGGACVRSRKVTYVPGVGAGETMSAMSMLERYVSPDYSHVDVLLVDFLGTDKAPGALERLQKINDGKSAWMHRQLIATGISIVAAIVALLVA
ncbi:MAG: hypothetical protein IPM16_06670 [Chloroflexi bacterium]|nr:hypothetical protein [Chloroflexota bacterium]